MTNRPPIVFIHGMWGTPVVWQPFQSFYQNAGYEVYAPALRHHDGSDQSLELLGATSISDYVDDLVELISSFNEKPVLIGHSMGGLLALLLAGKGLASKAVLLAPAAPAGFWVAYPSVLKTFSAVLLRRGFWKRAMKLSPKAANYGLFNCLPDEARAAHYQDMVYESGRVAAEIAFWFLDKNKSTAVEQKPNCRMLVVAGCHDRVTPANFCHQVACRFGADFHLLKDNGHWLISEPGWELVAEQCEIWLSTS